MAGWLESAELLLNTDFSSPVTRIPAIGQAPQTLFEFDADRGEMGHGAASHLPDGDCVRYSYWDDRWRIGIRALSSGARFELIGSSGARFARPGI